MINTILIIGAGGTGGYLLPPLARLLYSKQYSGRFIIADGDKFDESNIDRQNFTADSVGQNKALYHGINIIKSIPAFKEQIEIIDEYLSKDQIDQLIDENTLVINCVDNLAARKFVEDRVVELNNATHICCGNEKFTGQVQISHRLDGKNITPSIYQRVPKFNDTSDDRSGLSCEELAALPGGGQIITANFMAAAIALNYVSQLMNEKPPFHNGRFVYSGITWFNCNLNSFLNEDLVKME